MHPNSLANLVPFEPGNTFRLGIPNPNAGAKPAIITDYLRDELLKPADIEELPVNNAQAIAKAEVRFAKAGSAKHADLIHNRTEGPLAQRIEISHEAYVSSSVKLITIVVPDTLEQFTQLQALAEANGQTPRQYAVQCLTQCLGEGP